MNPNLRAPLRRWQIVPRRWHRFLGRHIQTERRSSPFGLLYQCFEVTCSCGCVWTVVR